jgi:hypothetical protein
VVAFGRLTLRLFGPYERGVGSFERRLGAGPRRERSLFPCSVGEAPILVQLPLLLVEDRLEMLSPFLGLVELALVGVVAHLPIAQRLLPREVGCVARCTCRLVDRFLFPVGDRLLTVADRLVEVGERLITVEPLLVLTPRILCLHRQLLVR